MPGSGKTTLLRLLEMKSFRVVEEDAPDVVLGVERVFLGDRIHLNLKLSGWGRESFLRVLDFLMPLFTNFILYEGRPKWFRKYFCPVGLPKFP